MQLYWPLRSARDSKETVENGRINVSDQSI